MNCRHKIRRWWSLGFKVGCGLPLVRITELTGFILEPLVYECRRGHRTWLGPPPPEHPMCRCLIDPVLPDPNHDAFVALMESEPFQESMKKNHC